MVDSISCPCGYRGPSVTDAGRGVCPICRTPAGSHAEQIHVPCPRGHVLEVSESMLGQRVVCPRCNQLFVLSAESSLEHKRETERLQHEQDARRARVWLSRAVWAAVLVVTSLVSLIVVSALPK